MQTSDETSEIGRELRSRVLRFMGDLPIPQSTPSGEVTQRASDGVTEFYKHWRVRGESDANGLFASFADHDDVIEFGLTERSDDQARNVLHATLVLVAECGELNVVSESYASLNLDASVTPQKASELDAAMRCFGAILMGKDGAF